MFTCAPRYLLNASGGACLGGESSLPRKLADFALFTLPASGWELWLVCWKSSANPPAITTITTSGSTIRRSKPPRPPSVPAGSIWRIYHDALSFRAGAASAFSVGMPGCTAGLAARPGVGLGPRHRRPRRPADPSVAVRLDRDGRDGYLVPRAIEPLVQAPAAAPAGESAAPCAQADRVALRPDRGRAVHDRRLRGPRGGTEPHVEPRPHLHLRDLLGRDPARERVRRRHLPTLQPLASGRTARRPAAHRSRIEHRPQTGTAARLPTPPPGDAGRPRRCCSPSRGSSSCSPAKTILGCSRS